MTAGAREKLLYVPCIIPDQKSRPDYLATVDVDPESATYSQVGGEGLAWTPSYMFFLSANHVAGDPPASNAQCGG
jgi:hypothetical protein